MHKSVFATVLNCFHAAYCGIYSTYNALNSHCFCSCYHGHEHKYEKKNIHEKYFKHTKNGCKNVGSYFIIVKINVGTGTLNLLRNKLMVANVKVCAFFFRKPKFATIFVKMNHLFSLVSQYLSFSNLMTPAKSSFFSSKECEYCN